MTRGETTAKVTRVLCVGGDAVLPRTTAHVTANGPHLVNCRASPSSGDLAQGAPRAAQPVARARAAGRRGTRAAGRRGKRAPGRRDTRAAGSRGRPLAACRDNRPSAPAPRSAAGRRNRCADGRPTRRAVVPVRVRLVDAQDRDRGSRVRPAARVVIRAVPDTGVVPPVVPIRIEDGLVVVRDHLHAGRHGHQVGTIGIGADRRGTSGRQRRREN